MLILIDGWANVNAQNDNHDAPLHIAADCGNLNVIKLLIRGGADPEIKNGQGLTASDIAQENSHNECVECVEYLNSDEAKKDRKKYFLRLGGERKLDAGIETACAKLLIWLQYLKWMQI